MVKDEEESQSWMDHGFKKKNYELTPVYMKIMIEINMYELV